MSGWGSWATGLAKHATSTVTQFGTDVLDSVTAVDDNDDDEVARAQARALFEYESEGAEKEAIKGKAVDDAGPSLKANSASSNSAARGDAPQSGWLPPELGFAAGRGKTLLSLGRTAVESGASAAGKAMDEEANVVAPPPTKRRGDDAAGSKQEAPGSTTTTTKQPDAVDDGGWDDFEDFDDDAEVNPAVLANTATSEAASPAPPSSAPAATAATAKTTAAAAAATPHIDDKAASDVLAETRGELTLAVHEAGHDAVERLAAAQVIAEEVLDPVSVGEFSIDGAEEEEAAVEWVAHTPVGARIRTARKDLVALLSETTGEPLQGDELIAALPSLPERAAEVSGAIIDIVQQELASVLSVVRGAVECDEAGAGWWPAVVAEDQSAARLFADAIRAVVFFALCEASAGTRTLCDFALQAATYAKQSDRDDAKQVKQRSLDVRGDCHIDAAAQFEALEVAAESALVIGAAIAALLEAAPVAGGQGAAGEPGTAECLADDAPLLAPAEVAMPELADDEATRSAEAVSVTPPCNDANHASPDVEAEAAPTTVAAPVSPPKKPAGGKGKGGGKRKGLGGSATKKAD